MTSSDQQQSRPANDVFHEYRSRIDAELGAVLERYAQPASLYEPFVYSMAGSGKRVRPMMTVLSSALFDTPSSAVFQAGIAIEIMHTLTLVHDDIMDKAELRRGMPAVYKKWGDATAILCGDVMMGIAYRLLVEHVAPAHLREVMALFTEGFIEVCEGQAMDLDFATRSDISVADYMLMIEKKTARLPEIAAAIGAVLGGAGADDVRRMRHFAREAGLAFQMQDDLLDLTAEQSELGKTIGQDIVEGKKTFMILRTEELAVEVEDRRLIERFNVQRGLAAEEVPNMRNLMQRLGVLSETRTCIDDHYAKAMTVLGHFPSGEAREGMEQLVMSLIDRRR